MFHSVKVGRHSVDIHVGNRVRMRRVTLNISQSELAETLGLTIQQVQKYEKGTNRISASVLYAISGTLKAEPAFFFEGLPSSTSANIKKEILLFGRYDKFLATKDGVAVVEALTKLGSDSRKKLVRHIRRDGQYARQTTAGNDRRNCLASCFCLAKLAAIRRASSFVSRPVADLIYPSAYLNLQCVNLHLNNPKLIPQGLRR